MQGGLQVYTVSNGSKGGGVSQGVPWFYHLAYFLNCVHDALLVLFFFLLNPIANVKAGIKGEN